MMNLKEAEKLAEELSNYPVITAVENDNGNRDWNMSTVADALSGGGMCVDTGDEILGHEYGTENIDEPINSTALYVVDWDGSEVYCYLGVTKEECLKGLETVFMDCAYVNDESWSHELLPAELVAGYRAIEKHAEAFKMEPMGV